MEPCEMGAQQSRSCGACVWIATDHHDGDLMEFRRCLCQATQSASDKHWQLRVRPEHGSKCDHFSAARKRESDE